MTLTTKNNVFSSLMVYSWVYSLFDVVFAFVINTDVSIYIIMVLILASKNEA